MRHPSLVLLAACGLASTLAQAQTPTITFQGEVTDQTCTATINGQTNAVVVLPTVNQNDLAGANTTAGKTDFTLNISGCTALSDSQTKKVKVNFFAPSVSGENLQNTAASGAGNVAVQLLDGSQPIDFSAGVVPVEAGELSATSTSIPSKTFAAQYISEANSVTPGKVTALVEYTLSYL